MAQVLAISISLAHFNRLATSRTLREAIREVLGTQGAQYGALKRYTTSGEEGRRRKGERKEEGRRRRRGEKEERKRRSGTGEEQRRGRGRAGRKDRGGKGKGRLIGEEEESGRRRKTGEEKGR